MDIIVDRCLEGAKKAEGLVVIIDVIRGSSTIVQMFESGVKEVFPVDSKERGNGSILCSEKVFIFPRNVEVGNSPYEVSKYKNFGGKKVLIKTYSCTKGILNTKSDDVILGCFLNADAVVNYIKKRNPKTVSLIAMGDRAKRKCIEDELFAEYLKERLEGKNPDFEAIRKKIMRGSISNWVRYIITNKHLDACLRLDTSNIVPKFEGDRVIPIQT